MADNSTMAACSITADNSTMADSNTMAACNTLMADTVDIQVQILPLDHWVLAYLGLA
jgi:hypothetical protein